MLVQYHVGRCGRVGNKKSHWGKEILFWIEWEWVGSWVGGSLEAMGKWVWGASSVGRGAGFVGWVAGSVGWGVGTEETIGFYRFAVFYTKEAAGLPAAGVKEGAWVERAARGSRVETRPGDKVRLTGRKRGASPWALISDGRCEVTWSLVGKKKKLH
jgi:hypothetical protein